LDVRLGLDSVNVGGTGGDTHRTNGEPAAGNAGRDENNRVVSHRCRGRIKELIFDRLAFCVRFSHGAAPSLVGFIAASVLVAVAVDTTDGTIYPIVHCLSGFTRETVAITVLLEALDGLFEAFFDLFVVSLPR